MYVLCKSSDLLLLALVLDGVAHLIDDDPGLYGHTQIHVTTETAVREPGTTYKHTYKQNDSESAYAAGC